VDTLWASSPQPEDGPRPGGPISPAQTPPGLASPSQKAFLNQAQAGHLLLAGQGQTSEAIGPPGTSPTPPSLFLFLGPPLGVRRPSCFFPNPQSSSCTPVEPLVLRYTWSGADRNVCSPLGANVAGIRQTEGS
jgi:hypothetical protein